MSMASELIIRSVSKEHAIHALCFQMIFWLFVVVVFGRACYGGSCQHVGKC